ncbi:hypothetical protein [Streptomyces sp. NPDC001970]
MVTYDRDAVARQLSHNLGTADPDYAAYCARIDRETRDPANAIGGQLLPGVEIVGGVSGDLLRVLVRAKALLRSDQRAAIAATRPKIQGLNTKDFGGHEWGFCLDINSDRCPYLIGERGEQALDLKLALTYGAISLFMRGVPSVLNALPLTLPAGSVPGFYDSLKRESDDFKVYFGFLDQPVDVLRAYMVNSGKIPSFLPEPAQTQLALTQKSLMVEQYRTLTEHPGTYFSDHGGGPGTPILPLEPVIKANGQPADRPFKHTDPRNGFLDALPKDLVVALTTAGMDWGACSMGPESGDIMHFQYLAEFAKDVKRARQEIGQ